MRPDVQRDLSDSASAFVSVVWPKIGKWFGGGRLLPVESVTDSEFTSTLDMLAGIDAWHVLDNVGIRGIASRVQRVAERQISYSSFTIRSARRSGAETELAKRIRAMQNPEQGWLLPTLTIQAYVSDDQLEYAAAVRTRDMFEYIIADNATDEQRNRFDGNAFKVVWVDDLITAGYTVREYGKAKMRCRLLARKNTA